MYDESPKFSGKIYDVLTINAASEKFVGKVSFHKTFQDSENQAVEVYVAREKFGSWEPGLLPLEGMSDQKKLRSFRGYSR